MRSSWGRVRSAKSARRESESISEPAAAIARRVKSQLEVARSEEDRLAERGERLDRVAERLHRHLRAHGERELAEPFACLRTDADRAHEDAAFAGREELHEAGLLRVGERRGA